MRQKYTVWKQFNSNDMHEVMSSDLLVEVAKMWHDYDKISYSDKGQFVIVVTNNHTDENLSDEFLHLAYMTAIESDYVTSISLEQILETINAENTDNDNDYGITISNKTKNLIN